MTDPPNLPTCMKHRYPISALCGAAAAILASAVAPAVQAAPFTPYSYAVAELHGHGCPQVVKQDVDRGSLGVASAGVSGSAAMNCEAPSTNFPWTSYAFADGDMFNGELHAVTYAASDPRPGHGAITFALTRTAFADRIRLHGHGTGLGTIRLDLDGVVSSIGDAVFTLSMCVGVSRGEIDPTLAMSCRNLDNMLYPNNYDYGVPTELEIDWSLARKVTVSEEPINIFVGLGGYANSGSTGGRALVDVGHTARLSIDLPDGVGFTSESGYLLAGRNPPSAVPEPSTALLSGLAGVVGWMRRRRRPRS